MFHFLLLFLFLFHVVGCQRQPSLAPAAEPSSKKAVAPMGSSTTNDELLKKRVLLDALLDGKIPQKKIQAAQNLAIASSDEETSRLQDIFKILSPELFAKGQIKPGLQRELLIAEFYFYERRFIESAHLLSMILDQNANYPRARNLLARCFYFLGNADRTMVELEYVLSHQHADAEELLDALFMMGASALESSTSSTKILKKGIHAWDAYLKVAPKNDLREKVESGLAQLRLRLAEADMIKPKAAALTTQSAATQTRLNLLKKEAKPWEQLKARGLDAFDANDLLLAEKKLTDSLTLHPSDAETETTLARIYIKTNRITDALARFERVVKRHANHVPAWHYKGMAHIMGGDPRKAVECWNQVVQKDPNYAAQFKLYDRIAVAKGML